MTALLAGTNKGLFLVDGTVKGILKSRVYGITWDLKGNLYITKNAQILCCPRGSTEFEAMTQLIHDVHQILWWNGFLYWTATSRDRVERWDGSQVTCVYDESESRKDRNHLNSLWCDGAHLWIVEHRRGVEPMRVQVVNLHGELIDTHRLVGLKRMHNAGLHNVYVENGVLYTLSVDSIVMMDLATCKVETRHEGEDYLRGLARTDGRWWVGRSNLANRKDRNQGNSSILEFDDNFKLVNELILEDTGQIHEIRVLEGDLAHNRIPFLGGNLL